MYGGGEETAAVVEKIMVTLFQVLPNDKFVLVYFTTYNHIFQQVI